MPIFVKRILFIQSALLLALAVSEPRLCRGREADNQNAEKQPANAAPAQALPGPPPIPEATLVPDLAHSDRPAGSTQLQRADGKRVAPAP